MKFEAREEMVSEYKRRRDYVVSRLNNMPFTKCAVPLGAFYAFPDVSGVIANSNGKVKNCSELANYLLETGHVAVLPGTDFGGMAEGFLRLSYVASVDKMKEGLDRIGLCFATLTAHALKNSRL